MPLVEIRDLIKDYRPVRAVDGLSFGVEPGTITGFLGPTARARRRRCARSSAC
jgi:ABC-2 type transport system ATP-binding protein